MKEEVWATLFFYGYCSGHFVRCILARLKFWHYKRQAIHFMTGFR
jgi:hypothetical protein